MSVRTLAVFAAAALSTALAASTPCVDGVPVAPPDPVYETQTDADLAALVTKVEQVIAALDITYYFLCASMVFLMQLGFAMLEVGCVSEKNINNIILKGTLDIVIAALFFWAFGWAIAFGGGAAGSFIGGNIYWFGSCLDYDPTCVCNEHYTGSGYHEWFFQFAFAAAASTIVSGAVAERCTTICYVVYAVLLTAFVYPVVVHWQWGGGLTGAAKPDGFGAVDYAGSGVVHMTGGLSAIIGAAIIGPRTGRFEEGSKIFRVTVNDMPAYSVVFQTLGTLVLWFGWYGFNTGSTLGIFWVAETAAPGNSEAGLVIINTTLAPAAGGLTAMLCAAVISKVKEGTFTLMLGPVLNGILAGLVSITAGCGDVRPGAAFGMGAIGGLIYTGTAALQQQLMIDDVVDAGPVHFWCGMWGVLALGLFADDTGTGLTGDMTGLFYGGGELFANNLLLVVMIIVWVGPTMGLTFGVLRLAGLARVNPTVEDIGLDISKHGVRESTGMTPTSSRECSPAKSFTSETPSRVVDI